MTESVYKILLADKHGDLRVEYQRAAYFDLSEHNALLFYNNEDGVPFRAINNGVWAEVIEVENSRGINAGSAPKI